MQLEDISLKIRQHVFKAAYNANGGHIAPAFSMVEIMSVLYFDNVLKYDAQNPKWNERDIFVLSKGHGALALYATLAIAGYFSEDELATFCKVGSEFGSLAKMGGVPGVEATTGSLGHGLSFAVGIALANKIDKIPSKVYVLLGDGECEEGSIWEGFMSAAHHSLDNLVIIIDHNKLQAMDRLETILSLKNLSERLSAFGFFVEEVDGHNHQEIKSALVNLQSGKPKAIIANTIKGKGVSFMENVPLWHYRIPNAHELKIALRELKLKEEEINCHEERLFRNII